MRTASTWKFANSSKRLASARDTDGDGAEDRVELLADELARGEVAVGVHDGEPDVALSRRAEKVFQHVVERIIEVDDGA